MDSLKSFIESLFVRILKPVFDPLHEFLDQLPPSMWRFSVCVFLLVGALWSLFLSRKSVFRGCQTQSKWADLRLWVCVLIVPYFLIYLIL